MLIEARAFNVVRTFKNNDWLPPLQTSQNFNKIVN